MISGFGNSRLERYLHCLTLDPYNIGVICQGEPAWAEIILTTDKTLAYAQIRDLNEFGFSVSSIKLVSEDGELLAIEVFFCRSENLV